MHILTLSSSTKQSDEHFRTDHLLSDLKGRSIRGVAVTLGAQALKFFIGLGATIILARLLSVKDYGMLAMVGVITGFVGLLRDGGLGIATVQGAAINSEQISTLFWINATLGVVLAVIVASISPVVAWFYNDSELLAVTVAMAVPFILGGLTVQHQALLQRQMRFKTISGIEIANVVISAGVGIGAATAGWGYWSLVIMSISYGLVNSILVLWLCPWRPNRPAFGSGVREMLKFGGVLTLNNLFDCLGGSVDKLLLGKFYTADSLGLYTRAQALMLQPLTQLMPAVQNVMLPAMSRLMENPKQFRIVFLEMLQMGAFACSFMAAFLVVNADWLIGVLLGPKWGEATDILRLLAGPAFFIPIGALCLTSLTAQSKSNEIMLWGMLKNIIIVIAVLLGLPWGVTGVAASLSITAVLLLFPILNYFTAKAGPATLKEIWFVIGVGVGLCLAACAAMFFLRYVLGLHSPFLGLLFMFLVNSMFHAAAMWLIPSGRKAIENLMSLASCFRTTRSQTTGATQLGK